MITTGGGEKELKYVVVGFSLEKRLEKRLEVLLERAKGSSPSTPRLRSATSSSEDKYLMKPLSELKNTAYNLGISGVLEGFRLRQMASIIEYDRAALLGKLATVEELQAELLEKGNQIKCLLLRSTQKNRVQINLLLRGRTQNRRRRRQGRRARVSKRLAEEMKKEIGRLRAENVRLESKNAALMESQGGMKRRRDEGQEEQKSLGEPVAKRPRFEPHEGMAQLPSDLRLCVLFNEISSYYLLNVIN